MGRQRTAAARRYYHHDLLAAIGKCLPQRGLALQVDGHHPFARRAQVVRDQGHNVPIIPPTREHHLDLSRVTQMPHALGYTIRLALGKGRNGFGQSLSEP